MYGLVIVLLCLSPLLGIPLGVLVHAVVEKFF